ncbi:MAG: hypothetical protein ACXWDO_04615, partial [Bacteroidia bacterium]
EMVYWTRLTHSDTTLHTPPKGAPAFFKSHDDYRSYYGKTSGSWTVHHNDSDNKAKYLNSGDLFWYPFKDGEIARGNSTYIKFDGLISYDSPFLGMLDSTISLSCNIDLDPLKFKHFTNMYLAKNIGVVQIKYTNGDVWNLVDYKIKK